MLVKHEQLAARSQRGCDAPRPAAEIGDRVEAAAARVGEIESSASQLRGQILKIGLHPEDRRPALTRGIQCRAFDVDTGDDCATLRELGRSRSGATAEMQHALALQLAERTPNLRGEAGPVRRPRSVAAVRLLPRAEVVLGRLHQAGSEKPPSM